MPSPSDRVSVGLCIPVRPQFPDPNILPLGDSEVPGLGFSGRGCGAGRVNGQGGWQGEARPGES